MAASRGSRVVCRRCGLGVADAGRKPRDGKIILHNIQVRVRSDWVKMADNLQIINSKPLKRILLLRTKIGKSKDYCKADSEQRVLFFEHNNISAGHTSPLQVYRCYWTGGGGRCLKGNLWYSHPANMTSCLASVTFKMASKVFIEETDKNFDFNTEILFRFPGFGGFKVSIVIEN